MIGKFSARYGAVLQEMLAETAGSIIMKTDVNGFIEDASPGLEELGLSLAEMLFKPHLADLTCANHSEALRRFHADVLNGDNVQRQIEFPVATTPENTSWYSLSLRPAPSRPNGSDGALGLLRSIDGRRSLEQELATAATTDLATGLANARAFRAFLAQIIAREGQGAVAVFEVDRLATLKLRFGHSTSDDVLWAFARFLGNMLEPDDILARLDGDRFAVLMSNADAESALGKAKEIIATFTGISRDAQRPDIRLSASAGIASVAGSLETVLIHAERALVVARALGGGRAELRDAMPASRFRQTGS